MLSAVLHFFSIFHIYEAPRELMILIYIGALVVIYPALIIKKKTSNEVDVKDFNKALFGASPRWLLTMNGLIFIYVFGWLIFLIIKRYFGNSAVTNGQGIMVNESPGFSSHWMALYSIAFYILYSCKRLKEVHAN
jgi:hypothetical protein